MVGGLTLDGDMVLVPVSIGALPAVLKARNAWEAAQRSGIAEGEVPSLAIGSAGWTESMLRQFAEHMKYPKAVELFDACATVPGEWVPKSQIDGDDDPRQSRNELGAMTKMIHRLFGRETAWPIQYQKVAGGRYEYRLDTETAELWREIRGLDVN